MITDDAETGFIRGPKVKMIILRFTFDCDVKVLLDAQSGPVLPLVNGHVTVHRD